MENTPLKRTIIGNKGFSLVEMIIVITIVSLLMMFAVPRLSKFVGGKRNSFIILTSIIAKTYDDSFLKERVNFLTIHLHDDDPDFASEMNEDVFARRNGVSVVTVDDKGTFVESKNKMLAYKEFPESFRIESVLLSTGEDIKMGNVMIPFYPDATTNDTILHILVNDEERWSVRIYKLHKEAQIIAEYVDFEER